MKYKLFFLCLILNISYFEGNSQTSYEEFEPGEIWADTDGNPINAHGGGILLHNGTYYWYGEIKKGLTWLLLNTGWYVWLPGEFKNGKMIIEWRDQWSPNDFRKRH